MLNGQSMNAGKGTRFVFLKIYHEPEGLRSLLVLFLFEVFQILIHKNDEDIHDKMDFL